MGRNVAPTAVVAETATPMAEIATAAETQGLRSVTSVCSTSELRCMHILSWNASGMSYDSFESMLDILRYESVPWDVLLIPEGPKQDESTVQELTDGSLWFVAASEGSYRSVSILLHARWSKSSPSFKHLDGRSAKLQLTVGKQTLVFIVSHLPHAGHPQIKFDAALQCIEEEVTEARKKKHLIIIGIDANATLGSQEEHDSKEIVGPWGISSRNERGHIFAAWLHMNNLSAANTLFKKRPENQWTHKSWSSGSQRQIDFMLRPFPSVDVAGR